MLRRVDLVRNDVSEERSTFRMTRIGELGISPVTSNRRTHSLEAASVAGYG
jgi:hypothetical protein